MVTPQPLNEEDNISRFLGDKADLAQLQDAPCGPVSVQEAIARSLKYNLDNRLAQMEEAFSLDQLSAAKLQMLPRMAVNAGYSIRNNESASSSFSYKTRQQSLEPSFSTEKEHFTGDISFSWSLLDFGLSYFQAKQQADRHLIMGERRRRIMNNLVKEVIIAYYRVASLERIRPQVDESIAGAQEALETFRRLEEAKTSSVAQALEQQRTVIAVLGQLRQLSTELSISRARLAALMNIPQGQDFQLSTTEMFFSPPMLQASLPELENIGVYLRPDLREEAYLSRIDAAEVKKDMLRMFPGVSVFTGPNYDTNKYLMNQFWYETGARVTMDIVGLAGKYKPLKATKTQAEVARIRRLAATVSAMVQIDMSYYQYLYSVNQYADSTELARIDSRLLEIRSAEAKAKSIGRMDQIMQGVSSVNSKLDADRRLIDVLVSWADLYFSIGGDILHDMPASSDMGSLVCAIDSSLNRWLTGELPRMPNMPDFRCLTLSSGMAYGSAVVGSVPAAADGDTGLSGVAMEPMVVGESLSPSLPVDGTAAGLPEQNRSEAEEFGKIAAAPEPAWLADEKLDTMRLSPKELKSKASNMK